MFSLSAFMKVYLFWRKGVQYPTPPTQRPIGSAYKPGSAPDANLQILPTNPPQLRPSNPASTPHVYVLQGDPQIAAAAEFDDGLEIVDLFCGDPDKIVHDL
jgi:hypothetical protein